MGSGVWMRSFNKNCKDDHNGKFVMGERVGGRDKYQKQKHENDASSSSVSEIYSMNKSTCKNFVKKTETTTRTKSTLLDGLVKMLSSVDLTCVTVSATLHFRVWFACTAAATIKKTTHKQLWHKKKQISGRMNEWGSEQTFQ